MRPPAHLQVGRIQPQIGPVAFERTFQEGLHALVDFLAQFRDLALRDAGKPHRLRDFVDPARRHPADPGLLDDGDQRLFRRLARLQERREVAAGPQLRDLEIERAKPRVKRAVAVAVAPVQSIGGPFVPASADQPLAAPRRRPPSAIAGRSRPQHVESHRRRPSAEAHSVAVSPRSSWSSGQCVVQQLHPRPPAAVTTPTPLPDRRVFPPPFPPKITPRPWTLPAKSACRPLIAIRTFHDLIRTSTLPRRLAQHVGRSSAVGNPKFGVGDSFPRSPAKGPYFSKNRPRRPLASALTP